MLSVRAVNLLYRRRPERGRSLRRRIYRRWARAMCAACGIRIRCSGAPPDRAAVLVSNHLSYLDILVIATQYPARFVAKSELGSWPLVGAMCRSVDTIFVDRSSRRDVVRVGGLIESALAEGDGVILCPVGTSSRGREVAPFKTSLLALAADRHLPVWCATLHFATPEHEPAPDNAVAWWGDTGFGPHVVRLLQLERIDATLHFAAAPTSHPDRKQLGDELRRTVAATFVPLRSDQPVAHAATSELTYP